jgi:ADP-ribose pyrophosphatase YjhB (NUDIX family)
MEQNIHKVGSIPFQVFKDKVAVLFVTSQVRGRWILPKGILVAGESHDDACHRETYKESGVKGRIIKNFPVTKRITKLTSKGIISTPVTFYPLLVQKQDDDWPDKIKRQRHWALLRDVHKVASKEDYINVLKSFEELKPWKLI